MSMLGLLMAGALVSAAIKVGILVIGAKVYRTRQHQADSPPPCANRTNRRPRGYATQCRGFPLTTLYAISDLHLAYASNRQALLALPAYPEAWLIVGTIKKWGQLWRGTSGGRASDAFLMTAPGF